MSLPLTNVRLTTSLAAKISSTASSCTLNRSTDAEGTTFAGTYYLTFDEGTSKEEDMIVTLAGAAGTIVTRGLSKVDAVTLVTANRFEHDRGAEVKMTNNMLPRIIRRLNGAEAFDVADRPYLATDTNATDDKQFATRGEINRVAMGGVTTSRVIVIGTAGETVAAGNLVYLKAADGFWWKCDADTAATVDNIILGIAQGAGTAAASISGGVLLSGVDSNQSGMTIGATQYASNTAGAISSSAGTVEVTVGAARSATDLYFSPRYNQQITEDQQDALAGTSGTPSSTNPYVTQQDILGKFQFGGDGTDGALAITSGVTTIDCVNAKYLIKNYTSISITGTGSLAFSNPSTTGTVVILRSQGAVTITSSTNPAIDVRSFGAPGGTGGAVTVDGVSGSNPIENIGGAAVLGVKGLTGSSAAAAGGAAATLTPFYTDSAEKLYRSYRQLTVGAGGGGGGGNNGGGTGSGSAGGRGGGGLLIECAGAYNVTSTLNASGGAGTAGGNSGGAFNGGGGGGGGAGGSIIALYRTLTADSGTYTAAGGAGGAGGTYGNAGGGVGGGGAGGGGGYGGAGGAGGGANAGAGSGTNGSNGTGSNGGVGGTGGSGSGTGSGGGGGGGGAGGFSLVSQVK